MLFIYNLLFLANFVIFMYGIYVVFNVITNKEQYIGQRQLDKLSNLIFKDLFETKLVQYKKYKHIFLLILVSIIMGILLSVTGHMLVSAQMSQAQNIINNAANDYNKMIKNIPQK